MPDRASLSADVDEQRLWFVTVVDRGTVITVEVKAEDADAARAEAMDWHPLGRVSAVEAAA